MKWARSAPPAGSQYISFGPFFSLPTPPPPPRSSFRRGGKALGVWPRLRREEKRSQQINLRRSRLPRSPE